MANGTVAVTGGLGFIGTHLCRALAMRGYGVRCIDRVSGRYAAGSGPAAWAATPSPHIISWIQADVGREPLQRLFEGTDAVIHLAALPGVRAAHEDHELQAENVENSVRVAAECARRGRRFVLASTSSVYGDMEGLPSHEAARPRPLNPYAASKLAAEAACLALPRRIEADTVVTRLFTVFGPGQRPDMAFARWIEAIAAGMPVEWCAHRSTRRDFTYVGDAVAGLIAALERGRSGQVYNVPGRGAVPLRHALETIERLLGRPARIRRSGPFALEARVTSGCGRKALLELGYRPAVSLERGLRLQLEHALNHRDAELPADRSARAARSSPGLVTTGASAGAVALAGRRGV